MATKASRSTAKARSTSMSARPPTPVRTKDRQGKSPGQDPCPILKKHGGIWKFDENKLGQTQDDGVRFATGLRQMPAITWHDGALYIAMNNRDQLDTSVAGPVHRAGERRASRRAFVSCRSGFQLRLAVLLLRLRAEKVLAQSRIWRRRQDLGPLRRIHAAGRRVSPPIGRRWTSCFIPATQFPAKYQDGAFIAFHGSWNRAPMPQAGYNVTFQPFSERQAIGKFRSISRAVFPARLRS